MKKTARVLPALATTLSVCFAWTTALMLRAMPPHGERERGDVPGWVMITLMSAILVAGLLAIATPALEDLFDQAMSKVGN